MPQRTIRFRIQPDGRVEEEVIGVVGPTCRQLTETIEARLGTLQQSQSKPEAFVSASTHDTEVIPLSQRGPTTTFDPA